MEDWTGVTTYTYDELARLKTVTYPANKTLTYTYDAAGNRATVVDPDGGTTTYLYDSRNVLSWLANPFAERTTWAYDALARVTTMTHANLSVAEHDYDAAGRITAVRNLKSDRSVISIFTYSYDAIANRTGVAEANGDLVTWNYDEAYQLTREQRSGANAYDTTFTYDGPGNRLTKLEGGVTTTYAYDEANQLLTFEDASGLTTFTYDANGNTTGELRPNGDRVTYTWDIENRMTKVEMPANVVNTITLDGDSKRRRIEDSDGLRDLIWDLENIMAETDSNDATVATYTLAPEGYGALISQRRGGATSFHHFDALGSTNKLTDANAATIIECLYRAFGEQTVLSGSSPNRFTWVGRLGYYREPAPDDYWVRARVVTAGTGRWLSRDPMFRFSPADEGDAQTRQLDLPGSEILVPYVYDLSNPAAIVDPSGLRALCTDEIDRVEGRAKLYSEDKNKLKYKLGGTGRYTDCSHYINRLFREAGISIPYMQANDMINAAKRGNKGWKTRGKPPCQPGDVLAFKHAGHGHVLFVGKEGRCYHASSVHKGTVVVDCDKYIKWRKNAKGYEKDVPVCLTADLPEPKKRPKEDAKCDTCKR